MVMTSPPRIKIFAMLSSQFGADARTFRSLHHVTCGSKPPGKGDLCTLAHASIIPLMSQYRCHIFVCTYGPWCSRDGDTEGIVKRLKQAVECGRAAGPGPGE